MCQEVGHALQVALSRRGLLKAAAGVSMAALSLMLGGAPVMAASADAGDAAADFDTRLILLGTAGSPGATTSARSASTGASFART